MRKVSKPVKMLAEFTPDEGAPIPRKFKWTDGRGYVETVIVDEVVEVDTTAIQFVIYECISYYENIVIIVEVISKKSQITEMF